VTYRIRGIDPAPFRHLYGQSDQTLARHGALRVVVEVTPGAPCRVELADAAPGDAVLLVNYEHLPVDTPYRSRHAIFVRDGATEPAEFVDAVPPVLACRLLSVRAFDAAGMMTDADVLDGQELDGRITRFFADPQVAYLHVHNAKRGCFAARVDRA
jgi:hypothetical protein